MKNPAWPPPAKFHNGQTILMGIGLGTLTFVFLFGSGPPGLRNLLAATGTASLYWISMILAPMFPGTAWNDPEFRASTPRPLGMHRQQLLAYVVLGLLIVALLFAVQSPGSSITCFGKVECGCAERPVSTQSIFPRTRVSVPIHGDLCFRVAPD
jgi:hypothetical protein